MNPKFFFSPNPKKLTISQITKIPNQIKRGGNYRRRESAETRRSSSMVEEREEEGRTPRFIRHLTPLRSGKSDAIEEEHGNDSKFSGIISAGGMIFRRNYSNPSAQNLILIDQTYKV